MPALNATDKSTNVAQRRLTYVILGSGGHTAEMCKINEALLLQNTEAELYTPVRYVLASSDDTSRKKLMQSLAAAGIEENAFIEVPRSRQVGQSWFTTIFSTFWALLWSVWLIWRDRPKLVLCNGPGTCVPFCYAAFFWRLLGRLSCDSKIVFIESFCRVRTLSLSGRLLLPLVDMFVVQWPLLAEKYKHKSNLRYYGRIM